MPSLDVEHDLAGWTLSWARLAVRPGAMEAAARARAEAVGRARERFPDGLTADPVVAAVRRLFRAAGTDPTRYRPSSEALLRRLTRGEERLNAGTFQVDEDGTAALLFHTDEPIDDYTWARVTDEPADGSEQPTGNVVVHGALEAG